MKPKFEVIFSLSLVHEIFDLPVQNLMLLTICHSSPMESSFVIVLRLFITKQYISIIADKSNKTEGNDKEKQKSSTKHPLQRRSTSRSLIDDVIREQSLAVLILCEHEQVSAYVMYSVFLFPSFVIFSAFSGQGFWYFRFLRSGFYIPSLSLFIRVLIFSFSFWSGFWYSPSLWSGFRYSPSFLIRALIFLFWSRFWYIPFILVRVLIPSFSCSQDVDIFLLIWSFGNLKLSLSLIRVLIFSL